MAAEHLVVELKNRPVNPFVQSQKVMNLLSQSKLKIKDKKLAEFVSFGVAYHHGGIAYPDRNVVEQLFMQSALTVICTTSTLAVGVNLPAHLVIIKGTSQYINGQMKRYSDLDVIQMIGRAGRPQFDKTGKAVIMTSEDEQGYFLDIISGKEIIESSLHESLIEHLNAEIALKSISSVDDAMKWLRSTFCYARIKKNPGYYKLKNCSNEQGKLSAENRLEEIFIRDIDLLKENNLVTQSATTDNIQTTTYGEIMANYYLKFETVVNFLKLEDSADMRQIVC